ncbi:MAG: hypothetical protein FJY99_09420 [Candidatus Sericytochromatia bacterium]|nr:hypothetical protein [Candidatus Tanganyikabacteria bacterium]
MRHFLLLAAVTAAVPILGPCPAMALESEALVPVVLEASASAAQAGREAERLPMELPPITVTGRRLRLPQARGRKVRLDDPDLAGMIEPPLPVRPMSGSLSSLVLPVPLERPGDEGATLDANPVPAIAQLELALGDALLGGPSTWRGRLGGAAAWTLGGFTLLSDARAEWHALDGWSTLAFDQHIAHERGGWAQMGLEGVHRRTGRYDLTRQVLEVSAGWDEALPDAVLTFSRAELANQITVGPWRTTMGTTQTRWQLEGTRTVTPGALGLPLRLDWTVGQVGHSREEDSANDGMVLRTMVAAEPWTLPVADLDLEAGLGATQLGASSYLDPALRLKWAPRLPGRTAEPEAWQRPLQLWSGLSTHADWPTLATLLRRRDPVVARMSLRPVRVEPRWESGLSWRLAPDLFLSSEASLARVLDPVVWREAGGGLWSIQQDPRWQPRTEARLALQWQPWEGFAQQVEWAFEDLPVAGVRHQELRLAHDARWAGDWAVGLDVLLEADQLSGAWLESGKAAEGSAVRIEGTVGVPLGASWEVFGRATSWPIIALREPAPGYYMRPALLVLGASRGF